MDLQQLIVQSSAGQPDNRTTGRKDPAPEAGSEQGSEFSSEFDAEQGATQDRPSFAKAVADQLGGEKSASDGSESESADRKTQETETAAAAATADLQDLIIAETPKNPLNSSTATSQEILSEQRLSGNTDLEAAATERSGPSLLREGHADASATPEEGGAKSEKPAVPLAEPVGTSRLGPTLLADTEVGTNQSVDGSDEASLQVAKTGTENPQKATLPLVPQAAMSKVAAADQGRSAERTKLLHQISAETSPRSPSVEPPTAPSTPQTATNTPAETAPKITIRQAALSEQSSQATQTKGDGQPAPRSEPQPHQMAPAPHAIAVPVSSGAPVKDQGISSKDQGARSAEPRTLAQTDVMKGAEPPNAPTQSQSITQPDAPEQFSAVPAANKDGPSGGRGLVENLYTQHAAAVSAQQNGQGPQATTQSTPLPAALQTAAQMNTHIAPQIVTTAATRPNGGIVDIALDPPELGRIEIVVELSDQSVRATISAERQATGDLLRRHLDILNQQFSDAGFEGIDLGFSEFQDDQLAEESFGDARDDRDHAPDTSTTVPTAHAPKVSRLSSLSVDMRL